MDTSIQALCNALISFRGRSIRLPSTSCVPSWVKIHGCGAFCSSPSICFHNFVVFSSYIPAHSPGCGVCVFQVFFEVHILCALGSALIANILSSGSWAGLDLCRIRRHVLAERCKDFALPQNFFVAQLPRFFPHFFHDDPLPHLPLLSL